MAISVSGIRSDNQPNSLTLFGWAGINQSATRTMIDDQQLFWCENLFPTTVGTLRAGWGPSAPIYTAPAGVTINRIFSANITTQNPSIFAFKSDGTVDRIDLNDNSVHPLGQIWGPATPPYWADLKLWIPSQMGVTVGQTGGAVIGSPQGLYTVDANDVVTAPGQPAPLWLTGGETADTTGAPLVVPTGLQDIYMIEVYQNRLWISGQTVTNFSAPNNAADFSVAGGGGAFGYFGDKLVRSHTDLAASAGFLFQFNDSSIDVIGNLQLVGQGTVFSPFTTAFQLSNIDPQNGHMSFRPVGHWSNGFTLINRLGAFGFQGQVAQLISQNIINLMATLDYEPFEPTQCPCDIHGKRWMLFNLYLTDPFGVARSILLCWDGQLWVAASQNYDLTHIVSYEENSSIQAYGTDGNVIVQLFAQPDPGLVKRLSTKTYKGPNVLTIKNWKRIYLEMTDMLSPPGPEGVSITGSQGTADGGIPNGQQAIAFDLPPGGFGMIPQPTYGSGVSTWIDLESKSPDFVLERLSITYDERTLFGA